MYLATHQSAAGTHLECFALGTLLKYLLHSSSVPFTDLTFSTNNYLLLLGGVGVGD